MKRVLGFALLLGLAPQAKADWRERSGVDVFVQPLLGLPVGTLGGRGFAPGGGFRLALGHFDRLKQRASRFELTYDGYSGSAVAPQTGDFFQMSAAVGMGLQFKLRDRWVGQPSGSVGYSLAQAGVEAVGGPFASGGFALLKRARLRHVHYGVEAHGGWWLGAGGGFLRAGPIIRWQR